MSEDITICLKNVSKCFQRYAHPVDKLKEILLPGKSITSQFWALQEINLEIKKGQTVGIVGRNGSGKSTLLQIIAGTLTPTTGEVVVRGRVSALLELGSGFNPEFTGRQNVFFNARLLGLNQQEIENKFDEIAAFADIGDFIEQPVKTYSSGMFVRLAFAVAVNVDPEILIVDEALAVGDIVFQHRCMRRMRNLMDNGVTTLFVSHDSGAIKTLCNSAVMIDSGKIYACGTPNDVIIKYMKLVTETELGLVTPEANIDDKTTLPHQPNQENHQLQNTSRRGNRKALIENIQLFNQWGEQADESPIFGFNEQVKLVVEVQVYQQLQGCIIGFFVCDKNGNELIGSNTIEENQPIGKLAPGTKLQVEFTFQLPLRPSSYSLTIAGAENYTAMTFDWIDNAMVFQVLPPDTGKRIHALVDTPISVKILQQNLPVKAGGL
ncbi:ABC transporter ATP-binding protein [Plectonema cf. radiosum LEGE 06105]|uniref:ABC transporter ATP-binding protein n=1 Tax=Plectonema cf. radiosum LEGE 06105 TaxID=945769 RepID=A0A8J7K355_9CYAN|nr:ABC transporter ATP-binding protein [Plectonema radiosum]MBE9215521.1 ABC transporter ATP-binding protein [Plectonema cf. radiosum LEGE 06105]